MINKLDTKKPLGIKNIPLIEDLSKRFIFIDNEIIRINLVINFQFIIFLINLERDFVLPGSVIYSIYKDMIVHTASIIECCINYCIGLLIRKGTTKEEDVMPKDLVYFNPKILYKTNEGIEICGSYRKMKFEKFNNKIQFKTLNDIALKAKIFDQKLFEKAEKLRDMRNKIHIASLEKIDDYYGQEDIDNVFNSAREIIERIEGIIKERVNVT